MSDLDILIVEDDRNLAYTMAAGLRQKLGRAIHVDICYQPSEAFVHLAQGFFDLVISDHHMPGISGLEMLSQIRLSHPDILLILITSYDVDELERKSHPLIDAYMSKPFEMSDLILVIQGLLPAPEADGHRRGLLSPSGVGTRN